MNVKFFVLVCLTLFQCNEILGSDQTAPTNETSKTFLYFSYGSNMQSKRIHKNSPSAKQIAVGQLKDHQLDFITNSPTWHGAVSTIVPRNNSIVWGVAWAINLDTLPYLDKQEGVDTGFYFAKNVTIHTTDGEELECRTYQQTQSPSENVSPNELPLERQPSPAYLNTIIDGAKEYNLPANYIEFLQSFRNNGYDGPVEIV